jgi:hypothetical protein
MKILDVHAIPSLPLAVGLIDWHLFRLIVILPAPGHFPSYRVIRNMFSANSKTAVFAGKTLHHNARFRRGGRGFTESGHEFCN